MSDSFNWNQFSQGWIPSDDAFNGRKNGCLQMDNLELDQNGAMTLAGGTTPEGSNYPYNAHTLYSNIIAGSRKDYLADVNGSIFRNGSSIGTGGDSSNAAFAAAYNFTLACSGNTRLKDNGSSTVNLGVAPNVEGIAAVAVDGLFVSPGGSGAATVVDPTGNGSSLLTTGEVETLIASGILPSSVLNSFGGVLAFQSPSTATSAVLQTIGMYEYTPMDLTSFNSISQLTGDPGGTLPGAALYSEVNSQDVLIITLIGSGGNLLGITSVILDVLLVTPDSEGDRVSDYFTQSLTLNSAQIEAFSLDAEYLLNFTRGDGITTGFQRVGIGTQGWESVYGFRITINTLAGFIGYALNNFQFVGAAHSLNGTYQFVQVNVNNTGSYEAKSILGTVSAPLTFNNQLARITPFNPVVDDSQCNEAWIYAIGGTLDQWYRIMIFNSTTGFSNANWTAMSDVDLIETDLVVNLNLVSIASSGITAKIFDIIGPIEGRWFYFTENTMYPSDINDPDLVDVSLGITTSNSQAEIFLWARRAAANQVWVGTSRDIYLLAGTFETLPDGSIDVFFQSLSCSFPPISYDASASGSAVFYLAADGWRTMDGVGNCTPLTPTNTDRLYRGIECYGYSVDVQIKAGTVRFPCVLARNKLWCSITGESRMEVLDPVRQYWRNFSINKGDCTSLCSTQDGNILGFFASDKTLRVLDVQTSLEIDGSGLQTVNILSPVFDGGTPKQRHEFYTIKVRLVTGEAQNLTVSLLHENGTTYEIGTVTSYGLVTEQILQVTPVDVPLGRYWQFVMTGQFSVFTLIDIQIEFDTRPQQLTYLHILPTDFDHPGRKRIPSLPFLIDTLGADVSFTPILDGVTQTSKIVNSTRIQSFDYQFTADAPARDWEFTLDGNGGVFEFIKLETPDYIEKLPEPKTFYQHPINNLGTASKKRVRVWPLLIDPLGNNVFITPTVDGSATPDSLFTGSKATNFQFFKTDVFGVDFSFQLTGGPFELYQVMDPDIVQVLPIARQFDQVGPEELFRYGRVKKIELRVLAFGTSIPYMTYFNDNSVHSNTIDVPNGQETTVEVGLPMGNAGSIVRIVFGPTAFNFHRYYLRLLVSKSGRDTDNEWVTLPDPAEGQ